MGHGGYDQSEHEHITQAQAQMPEREVFKERVVRSDMSPLNIPPRESRDSNDHPESLAIAFALDLTGSMHDIPKTMARSTLPNFMQILTSCGVRDPQLLFMGIGDTEDLDRVSAQALPLQVGQFESTADLVNRWLTSVAFVSDGCGNHGESYHLGFELLARKTSIDCFEKRGKRGYAFFTGDDNLFSNCRHGEIRRIFGDLERGPVSTSMILKEALERWNIFFVIPDRQRARYVEANWHEVLGDRVIVAYDAEDICDICGIVVALTEGVLPSLTDAAAALKRLGRRSERVGRIIAAVEPYAAAMGRGDAERPAEPVTGATHRRSRSTS